MTDHPHDHMFLGDATAGELLDALLRRLAEASEQLAAPRPGRRLSQAEIQEAADRLAEAWAWGVPPPGAGPAPAGTPAAAGGPAREDAPGATISGRPDPADVSPGDRQRPLTPSRAAETSEAAQAAAPPGARLASVAFPAEGPARVITEWPAEALPKWLRTAIAEGHVLTVPGTETAEAALARLTLEEPTPVPYVARDVRQLCLYCGRGSVPGADGRLGCCQGADDAT